MAREGKAATGRRDDGAAAPPQRRWEVGGRPAAGADPTADLSPTAQRILEATKRLLDERGFGGLTFEAIAAEAHENKASIRYHFGNKAGLIEALADSVVHDDNMALLRALRQPRVAGADRAAMLLAMHRHSTKAQVGYRRFWDLFPQLIRDEELRTRMAELYRWYRDLDEWALAPDADARLKRELDPLCAITVAVCDGLAEQIAADPDFDVDAVFDYWEGVVRELRDRAFRKAGIDPSEGSAPT
jgi:AcrR family transcriptional regulator